jgi:hypothetical protein
MCFNNNRKIEIQKDDLVVESKINLISKNVGNKLFYSIDLANFLIIIKDFFFETPGDYAILTDNISSIRDIESQKISLYTRPIVFGCKQIIWEVG